MKYSDYVKTAGLSTLTVSMLNLIPKGNLHVNVTVSRGSGREPFRIKRYANHAHDTWIYIGSILVGRYDNRKHDPLIFSLNHTSRFFPID